MNDHDLMNVLREQRHSVPLNTPVEEIISRGHAVRARRQVRRVAGILGVAAAAAVALVTTLGQPGSHGPGNGSDIRLTAWTVVRQSNGDIKVTVHELRDPAGLQRKLRSDGVPASVSFSDQGNPACQRYPISGSQSQRRQAMSSVMSPGDGHVVLVIHPAKLPSGAGVQIWTSFQGHGHKSGFGLSLALAKTSPACTGG